MTAITKPVSVSAIEEFCGEVLALLPATPTTHWAIRVPPTTDDVARTIRAFTHHVGGAQDALLGVHFANNPAFGGLHDAGMVAVRIGARSVGTASVFGPEPFGLQPAALHVEATPWSVASGLVELLPVAQQTYAQQDALAEALRQRRDEYAQTARLLYSLGFAHVPDAQAGVFRAAAMPGLNVIVRAPDAKLWATSGRLAEELPPVSMYATLDEVDQSLLVDLLDTLARHGDKNRSAPS